MAKASVLKLSESTTQSIENSLVFTPRRPFLGRMRTQVTFIMLAQSIAIVLGSSFYGGGSLLDITNWTTSNIFIRTMLLCACAAAAGYIVWRNLTEYTGARLSIQFIPTMLFAYSIAAVIALAFRIDYSRFGVAMSILGALLWMLSDHMTRLRKSVQRLTLVPGGDLRNIESIKGIQWNVLAKPEQHDSQTNAVVADLHHDHPTEWDRYIAKCMLMGIPVHDVKGMAERLTGRVEIEHLSENSFGAVLPSNLYLQAKGLVDFAVAVLLLPIFALVIAIVGIMVKRETPGPAIFKQERVGFRGQRFMVYKIRSMSLAAPEGSSFTKQDDDRITRIGKFIRKYRIDEMPQIINVLKGEMSWIGPRPEAAKLSEWYAREIAYYEYRHVVRPGLSGWAQINQGNVAEIEAVTTKLQFDFYYIKNFSPWLDLLIVFRTIQIMLNGFGSR